MAAVYAAKKIANAFNKYFASITKDMADSLPDVPGYEDHLKGLKFNTMWLRPLEEEEVGEIMKNRQPKMSCGFDTINNKIEKMCNKELTKPMTLVINKSIKECYVPQAYKKATIVPIYKTGATNECGNYRPVNLFCLLSPKFWIRRYVANV